ncbi:cellulose-growth-specific protein [Geopyxis carbonaria]|nr:cellulose-growth-specific protein [Geopyxis carbonaria]
MKFFAAISAAILSLPAVLAHGGVTSYVINGVEYQGFSPYNSPTGQTTIQRQYSSYDPILSPTDAKMACNTPGTGPAALNATVAAGSKITAKWKQWTHAEGPVTVYMAKVGNNFASSDGTGAVWFKIDETGLISGTVNKGEWGLGIVLKTNEYTSTIPANLAPGNYLIRHELLALHQANTPQFSFPGAWKASDPGVTIDIYSSTATTYTVPGPAKWSG